MHLSAEERRAGLQVAALLLLASLWRLVLSDRYYGWEESDYGNLMMVREVLDSNFTWFRPEYMPGYYVLGALSRLIWDAPRLAPLLMTIAFSSATVALAALLARKLLGAPASWMVGLWLTFQPEMALYGASTLRPPVFAAFVILGLASLVFLRPKLGFSALGLAFLVRLDALFVAFAPALISRWWDHGRPLRSLVAPICGLLGVVIAWQLYVSVVHDEGLFLAGQVGHNTQGFGLDALGAGVSEALGLLAVVLPRKISWAWWLLLPLGALALARGEARPGGKAVLIFAATALGFWLAEGFLARHGLDHNLYWVWLQPVIPLLALVAAAGWASIDRKLLALPTVARVLIFVALLATPFPAFEAETSTQLDRSERWYRPQLELARWLEDSLAPDTGVIALGIPRVWIQRRHHPLRLRSWMELPAELRGDRQAFARYLDQEQVAYLIWMREDWTEAPAIAPYLAAGTAQRVGELDLIPLDAEPGYGWILYGVQRTGEKLLRPPPRGQGLRGRGWP